MGPASRGPGAGLRPPERRARPRAEARGGRGRCGAMAESDWDTVTVLRKKGPSAAQAKSKQVSV